MSLKVLQQVIILVITFVVLFSYVQPQFMAIQELEVQVREYEDAINQVNSYNQKLRELLNQANTIESKRAALNRFLPAEIDEVAVARDLETLAELNDMRLRSIQVAEAADTEAVRVVQFADAEDPEAANAANPATDMRLVDRQYDITVAGSYDNFIRFLQSLEANIYPINVIELDASAKATNATADAASSEADQRNQYNLTVEVYALSTNE